jgi:hypothetical protein
VMPPADRAAFLEAKAALDLRLDAIALPEPPPEKPKAAPAPEAAGATTPASATSAPAAAAAPSDPGMKPSAFVEDTGDDEDEGGGQPIPAPLLNGLPMGPSTATPTSGPAPDKKPAAAAEPPPDNEAEEAEAH